MKRFATLMVIVLAVAWLATCFAFVDETEHAFVTRLGEPLKSGAVAEPGLLVKLPWPIDRVRRFDRRLQVYEPPAIERVTRDKKTLTIGCYVCWKIADVERFFVSVGTIPDAQLRLEAPISGQLSAAIGKRTLTELVSDEPDVSQIEPMMTELTEGIRRLANKEFGVEVVDVRLKRFNHPADVRQSIYDRIRSERNKDAVRYRAEGDKEGQKIRSLADLERDKVLATAEAEATETRGRAEAEKTRILNEAHAKDPRFYDLLRTLDAYRKILDEKTTLVLSTDNAIFKLLTEKSGQLFEPDKAAPGSPSTTAAKAVKPQAKGEKPSGATSGGP